ncbi:BaiN/RdsA family NAD(P)/FAD-dependent oxidoreductase [Cyclobacterium marinum]|uniref:NAD(P)/FAD-dependent oxidoreductase n=1 Tax=Cyclobacterium marinum TaxID=104 RepID=UPI0011EDF735|nr:NAD(P)/FAD-dependent oxidoreductase [Cyclobacterium marinum]MBI0397751.1 NAD(P)/FAD-dependent oxidoreductase [Cyclobacterium marinum]
MEKLKVGIIGGGASGFFAAIEAAKNGAEVLLFEKTNKVLSKVLVSGGGRCNVTNGTGSPSEFLKGYPRGKNFMKKVFKAFNSKDTIQWFESRGVPLKTEEDGRVFPVSNSSSSIVEVLKKEAKNYGVKVLYKTGIQEVKWYDDKFILNSEKEKFLVDKLVICTGGKPKKEGYSLVEQLGHTVHAPIPSLFTFNAPTSKIIQLKGLSVPNGHVRFEGSQLQYSGPILITHWGISGPAVLKLSAFGAEWLHEKEYKAIALIKWRDEFTEEGLRTELLAFKQNHPLKVVHKNPLFALPGRLWEYLIEKAEINPELKWGETNKKKINKLIENLMRFSLKVSGKTTFKEEFVTAGGVSLNEIDARNMESKLVKGLFFAGEVIDVDGITGGYNFQAAWSTGFLAGSMSSGNEN